MCFGNVLVCCEKTRVVSPSAGSKNLPKRWMPGSCLWQEGALRLLYQGRLREPSRPCEVRHTKKTELMVLEPPKEKHL